MIKMIRPNVGDIPKITIDPIYEVFEYKDGQEDLWINVINSSFGGNEWTYKKFHSDIIDTVGYNGHNIFIINHGEVAVGTVCAFIYIPNELGSIHMIGVIPEYRNKGIGSYLVYKALSFFQENNFRSVSLVTTIDRIFAIKMYLNFGFIPQYGEPNDLEDWSNIFMRNI